MNDKYELLRESLHELQREASAKGGNNPRSQMILDLLADYEALQAENERLRKDAERYRWIRDGGWLLIGEDRGNGPEWPDGEAVDALVDRAIAKAIGVTPNDQDKGK